MRKSRFSDQQIALALQQVEHGASVAEVYRKLGISEQTYYRWKKKFGEMAASEIKKMKQLEDENRRMKGRLLALFLLVLLAPAACRQPRAEPLAREVAAQLEPDPAARPELAPSFRLETLAGAWVDLEELRGKTVVIDFWATWCLPCKSQVPVLNAFYDAHVDGEVAVLGISADSASPATIEAWTRENGVRYPVLLGSLDLLEQYVEAGASPRLPFLVIVGPDGTIGSRHFGSIEAADLEAGLRRPTAPR